MNIMIGRYIEHTRCISKLVIIIKMKLAFLPKKDKKVLLGFTALSSF